MNKKIVFSLLTIIVIIVLYLSFKPKVSNTPIETVQIESSEQSNTVPFTEPTKPIIIEAKPVTSSNEVRFSGTVEAYSTGCYADGECSITIDGKKVTTILGWHQEVVGKVIGADSLDDVKIGAKADVYAKKTANGYTLYGNKDYYIDIK